MKKKYFNLLKIVIGITIILIVIFKVGIINIFNALKGFNLWYLIPILIFYILGMILGAFNVYLLLKKIKVYPFFKLFKYYMLSWAMGLLTLGKVGEFYLVYFLKSKNTTKGEILGITIINTFITAISLFLIAIFGFFLFFNVGSALKIISILITGFIVFLLIILTEVGRNIIKRFILRKYAKVFRKFSKTIFFFLKKKKKALIINYMITLVKWCTSFLFIYLFFLGFGTRISFVNILLIISVVTLVSLIPITVAGLGIKEATSVYLFSKVGADPSIVMGMYILILIIHYVTALIVFLTQKTTKKNYLK